MGVIYWNNGLSFVVAREPRDKPGEVYFALRPTEQDLAAAFPGYEAAKAAQTRRKVPKNVVVQRLTDAGKITAAKVALESDAAAFARWFAPGHTYVYADDPDALALLAAIGADPAVIMAP